MTAEHELLKQMLCDAAEILNRDNKSWWSDAGTLLGFIRDKGFIEWEHDVDLGMWKEKNDLRYKKKLAAEFRKRRYKTYFSDGHINIQPTGKRCKVWLDINFYERRNDMAVKPTFAPQNGLASVLQRCVWSFYDINNLRIRRYSLKHFCGILISLSPSLLFHLLPLFLKEKLLAQIVKTQNMSFFENKSWMVPTRFFDKLKNIRVLDISVPVPQDSENYLEYRYGTDWRTPNKDWDTFAQDKSVCGNR